MKELIKEIIEEAFFQCREEGFLKGNELPDFAVEIPRNKTHGDLASNLPMVLAKQEKKSPRDIAKALISKLSGTADVIDSVEIAGPGFINFHLKTDVWHSVLKKIEEEGSRFGSSDIGKGEKVMVEFVSANPTGPLHIGHGRGAAIGDALANILEFAGYGTEKEYYVNDVGNQIRNLGKSVYLRYLELLKQQVVFPEDLYKGEYIFDIAKEVVLKQGRRFLGVPEDESVTFFSEFASQYILEDIKRDLESFGVSFDAWFHEKKLFDSDEVRNAIDQFKEDGLAYEMDGALWFKSSEYGDEKDRVIIKEDGQSTYFASDIAYHKNKFDRGFTKAIDIWGADHHGYIPRIQSVLKAMGFHRNSLSVILVQMVNLLRDGKPVSMSTRSGEFVTLKQVVDEVGKDAARFNFFTRRSDAQLDFDLAIAKKQSDENPVYYVQYAHARISSIISFAAEKGLSVPEFEDIDSGLLSAPEEIDMLKMLSQFPWVITGSARSFEPHRIATYLLELVGQFHSYYSKHRVITDQEQLSRARLLLMRSVQRVLKNGLTLLGVNAPEKM